MVKQVALGEADRVQIISLVDDTVDFISKIERKGAQQVRKWIQDRMSEEWTRRHFRLPHTEH